MKSGGELDSEIEADAQKLISGKTYSELIQLETQILNDIDFKIDPNYWHNIFQKVKIEKYRARLSQMSVAFLSSKESEIKEQNILLSDSSEVLHSPYRKFMLSESVIKLKLHSLPEIKYEKVYNDGSLSPRYLSEITE